MDSNKVEEGVQTALESDDVKRLIKKLDSKGYKLNQTEIAGMGATLNNETYYEAVGLTLDSKHNSTCALIAVFENDEIIKVRTQIVERDETGYPLSVEILTVNGNTIVSESGEVSDILNGKTKASLISSATLAPITPRAMGACTACKLLSEGACNIGCGLEMAIFCALLGIPAIVGGLTCAAIATVVCIVVGEFGCGPTELDLCREAGYC
ncbi:halocin C8-like domain-containing protein [Methanosarcina sp.]|uniref:halocin C8-like domain-containing protein n=1 Tax=Methanosarcina sp. TaxID=2213 RepID=UPI002AB9CCD1|nr:halocin C8-like domain-containing protein [Methanosarcina sp.]MDY9926423.1 halocin C8-like domain-containing protein [Methanosarcina sp.]